MKSSILTVDIGTSSCKTVLFSESGTILAQGKGQYSLLFPQEGRVEQDPEEIFAGVGYGLISRMDLQDAIEFAAAASCLKHTMEGDFNRVTVEEVQRLMNGSGNGRVTR